MTDNAAYDVWMSVPGVRGYSLVAKGVSADDADVWDRTCLHHINIEESKKETKNA